MALEIEHEFYWAHREEFLQRYRDRFLLIKDKKVEGDFPSFKEAVQAAVSQFGLGPFFIKQVLDPEPQAVFLSGNVR